MNLNIIDKIHGCIIDLEMSGSKRRDIVITTSYIVKKFIEDEASYISGSRVSDLVTIHGVKISFEHFTNDIVIYDKHKACLNGEYIKILKFN